LICAGGAPVPTELKVALDELGLPVYEGYGLAEHTSVVTWNTPSATKHGTVGRPLAHVTLRIADDGEVLVKSPSVFAGYTIVDPTASDVDDDGWLHTGDLGVIDDEGYLSITGRKKSMVTTAQGRNVAPEWVEASYQSLPFVRVVGVAGDGLDALHGLFLIDPDHNVDVARKEIDAFGHDQLSDIERVEVMHVVPDDPATYEKYFTMTGRPRRDVISKAIRDGELA
jgi:long-subunit acyl-CoA synthetase (AMP-forming)